MIIDRKAYSGVCSCGKKHETAIRDVRIASGLVHHVGEILKENGFDFELNFIGTGEMENHLKMLAEKKGLSDCVHFSGSMKPENVRTIEIK